PCHHGSQSCPWSCPSDNQHDLRRGYDARRRVAVRPRKAFARWLRSRRSDRSARRSCILHSINAGPPCGALAMPFAPRTPTRGRLREGWKLEYSQRAEALSAQLLGRILINPVLSARLADVRFARSRAKSCHATIRRFVPPPPLAG